ncbi:MAG TPA: glycoside hydrolase family 16 protein [Pyrinomonadaceae bacterium]|nr:glycoside hydrolase family 16 protein [Pyrinomonadaceae bacterium]
MRLNAPQRAPFRTGALLFAASLAVVLSAGSVRAQTGWTLAWADEFNGPAGAAVDSAKWGFDVGGGGWGNRELEYYTDSTRNASTDGAGNLRIVAIKETLARKAARCWYGQCQYTSARLLTKGRFQQTYGRFEARLKIPYGQGIWPAFWMLGANIDPAGWPACGEIDIMENIGREPAVVHGTLHGPGYSGAAGVGAPYSLTTGQRFADDFHTFAVEWEPGAIRWYVDNQLYQTRTSADLPAGSAWVFDHPFFMILNVAVGGNWPGSPDATTTFPQTMLVDYVRVYRR